MTWDVFRNLSKPEGIIKARFPGKERVGFNYFENDSRKGSSEVAVALAIYTGKCYEFKGHWKGLT